MAPKGRSKGTKPETYPTYQEDAARLKAIYMARKAADKSFPSQLDFGQAFDLGTQGMVWQYLNARAPLNLSAATKFATGLRCQVADFSPHWAAMAEKAAAPETQDFVKVRRVEASLSAGKGALVFHEGELSPLAFQEAYLRGQGVAAKNAVVVNVKGRSMEPTLPEGAVILVNHAATEVVSGRIFAIRLGQEVLVKRLHKRDGTVIAVSDNPDRDAFPDILLGGREDFAVIGRAIWMGASL